MFLDRKKYTESAYIGEELFSHEEEDRLHKYMVVEQTIADGDFSMDEALTAYQVSGEEYKDFLAKKYNHILKASFAGASENLNYVLYIEVLDKMLIDALENKFPKHLKTIRKKLHQMSHDIGAGNQNA
jgi:hypothetical protein